MCSDTEETKSSEQFTSHCLSYAILEFTSVSLEDTSASRFAVGSIARAIFLLADNSLYLDDAFLVQLTISTIRRVV